MESEGDKDEQEVHHSMEMTNIAFSVEDETDVVPQKESKTQNSEEGTEEVVKTPEPKPMSEDELKKNKEVFEAAVKGDLPLLRQLHKDGAKINVVNEDGNPLIHFPVRGGYVSMVAFLIENKQSVNAVNLNGTDALQLAAYTGNNEILEMLIYAGANLNHQDTSGNSALHFACQFNHLISSMQLVNFGSRLDLINSIGDIALHGACRNSMFYVVSRMCVLGCPVNSANNQKETPLHLASKSGSCEVVRVLMLHGAKVELLDISSKTAEEVAGNEDVRKLFGMYKQVVQGSTVNKKFELRKKLNPSPEPLNQLKVLFLGNSGVGKTAVIESLKCGFLKSFLWSSYYTFSKSSKASKDAASRLSDPMGSMNLGNGTSNNHNYTKGISVQKTNISDVGDMVIMDFSGVETYFNSYSLFLGDSSCAHVIVVSLDDPVHVRKTQIDFWLEFIRIRMAPKEPIGFAGCNMWAPNVYIIVTNPRDDNCKKDVKGNWIAGEEWSFMNKLIERYEREMILNQPLVIMDAHLPNSNEMTIFKNMLVQQKEFIENFLPTRMGCLEDTLYELPAFSNSKADFPVVWFAEFADFVREKVNLLAMDDNIRELLVQLQLMGEVICFGTEPTELIVLKPNWLGCDVIGSLFSREALQSCSKWAGFVDQAFLHSLLPKIDFFKLVDLLKALGITFERTVNNTKEYYLHPFNKMDFKANAEELLQSAQKAPLKAVVHIETPFPTTAQLTYLFSSVITAVNMSYQNETSELSQWKNASRVHFSGNTGVVEMEDGHDNTALVVKCYTENPKPENLFSFCESICAVVFGAIDAVSPGLFFQRLPTSWIETQQSINSSICLKSEDILSSFLNSTEESERSLKIGDNNEKLLDVLTFGSEELYKKIMLGTEAHISCLSHFARGYIASLIDKDVEKCMKLAKKLKVDETMVPIENGTVSILDRLITYWNNDPDMSVQKFCNAVEECYGKDTLNLVLKLTPVFVYSPVLQIASTENNE